MKLVPVALQFRTKGQENGWWLCHINEYVKDENESLEEEDEVRVLYAIEEDSDD